MGCGVEREESGSRWLESVSPCPVFGQVWPRHPRRGRLERSRLCALRLKILRPILILILDCGHWTRGCLFARINFQQIIPALEREGLGPVSFRSQKGFIFLLCCCIGSSSSGIFWVGIVSDSLTQYFDVDFLVLDNFVQSAGQQVYFIMVFAWDWQIRRGLGFFRFYFRLFSFNAVLSLCFSSLKQKQWMRF